MSDKQNQIGKEYKNICTMPDCKMSAKLPTYPEAKSLYLPTIPQVKQMLFSVVFAMGLSFGTVNAYAELNEEEKIKIVSEYVNCLICLDISKVKKKIKLLKELREMGVKKYSKKKKTVQKELEKLEYILSIID